MIQAAVQDRQADREEHWEAVYADKGATEVSWYQDDPRVSLEFIGNVAPTRNAGIVDVGGGTSVLVDRLLDEGYGTVAVLDISAKALAQAKLRLGQRAHRVNWLVGDITKAARLPEFEVWHDRGGIPLFDPGRRPSELCLARRANPAHWRSTGHRNVRPRWTR
jgi:2-polyprenyl-3-methyl-5-hydroxy-6-metoxy-1,4-benzoquinol methylase